MNTDTFVKLLENSGFYNVTQDSSFVYMEDPGCVLRSFETFTEYAWIVIVCMTALLLTGWAISMIRGAENDIFTNMRNLILMFCVLAAVKPIVNFVYGDDLFARGCETIAIPIDQVNEMLAARSAQLSMPIATDVGDNNSGADDASPDDPDVPLEQADDGAANGHTGTGAISAKGDGLDVIYSMPDGTTVRRVGGSRAWRNNNPGNIVYTEFSRGAGAIGYAGKPSKTGTVYFAVFPDKDTGLNAIRKLLRTKSYQQKTVAQAIYKWCPDSTSPMYKRMVGQMTGIDLNAPMSGLNDSQLEAITQAIVMVEGWNPGTEQRH